jgi:hypothetical protein
VREHYVEIVKPDLREWRDAVGAGIIDKNIEPRAAFQCRNGRDIGEVEANVSALPASRRMASRSASSSRERARSFTCAPVCASAAAAPSPCDLHRSPGRVCRRDRTSAYLGARLRFIGLRAGAVDRVSRSEAVQRSIDSRDGAGFRIAG